MVTFTRASKATYINKQGVLTIAQNDKPRFEKEGILIEGSSTNIATESSYHKSAKEDKGLLDLYTLGVDTSDEQHWVYGGALGVNIDLSTAPVTGSYIVNPMGRRYARYELAWTRDGVTEYISSELIDFQGDGTSSDIKKEDLGGGLFRISGTIPHNTGIVTGNVGLYIFFTDDTGGRYFKAKGDEQMLVGGFQIEELPFATSYIPTDGTPATRAADSLTVPTANVSSNTTTSFSIKPQNIDWVSGYSGVITSYPSKSLPRFEMNTNNRLALAFNSAGVQRYLTAADTLSIGGSHLVYVLDDSNHNSYVYKDGAKVGEILGLANDDGTLGLRFSASSAAVGGYHIKDFRIWNAALTPEQIATL